MAIERTLSIIKPDAVAKNVIGEIYARFEKAGLKVVASRMMHLSRGEAEAFYGVHRERPFFKDLVEFMPAEATEARSRPWCRSTARTTAEQKVRNWAFSCGL